MKGFYDKVSRILEEIIARDFSLSLEYPLWELPKDKEFGDLSSMAALKLASQLKKDPLEIAAELKISLEKLLFPDIAKIEILRPGFINIFMARKPLIVSLNAILKGKDKFFRRQIKRKVLLEFLSANPTGPLSIAHGRQAVVGDAMANILEFFGNKVTREYYLNDEGRQIELLLSSVAERAKEIKGKESSFPEGGYQGEYIKDVAGELLKKKSKNIRSFVLNHIVSLIKKDLNSLEIKFDCWMSQRKIRQDKKVDQAIAALSRKGLMYEKDQALWFATTKFGDDKDRVIKKADGELTYFASDIAYHKDKLKRKYDQLINLWGPDHHGYIPRVKSAIKAFDYKDEMLKIIIIQLVVLKTKERMSKRAGTFILLSDLIKEVGPDTTRFYYLVRKNSSPLEFDIDLAKEASFNNPFYYVQYVCARIESIFRKAKVTAFETKFSQYLSTEAELGLLRTLLQFSYCLEKAYYTLEPIFIVEYLKSLAAGFHQFYENVRVIEKDKNKRQARLNLIRAVQVVFHCGLGLLGIKPVKRM